MEVKAILYHSKFVAEFHHLSEEIQNRAIKTEALFRQNPLYPSLRLHGLKGGLSGS